jgi:alkaline phosphatase D
MVGKGHTLSVTGNWDRRIDRRKFLAMSGMSAAALALGAQGLWLPRGGLAQTQGGYFQLGVASGDPELYDDTASGSKKVSVILWTRLAPGDAFVLPPTNSDQQARLDKLVEMQGDPLPGEKDLRLALEVKRADTGEPVPIPKNPVAEARFGHSVHHEVRGLEPGTQYSYQFTFVNVSDNTLPATPPEGEPSPIGYFKTPDTEVDSLKFAFASCQHWESGYYPAYRDIASRGDLDLVVHLGDYIYEGAPSKASTNLIRQHSAIQKTSAWCNTLFDYRTRHAQYKTDPNLQAAHAAHLWLVTWDDHEVENDYAGLTSWYNDWSPPPDPVDFAERRAAAYQAYYEHMPLRFESLTEAGGKVTNVNLNRQVSYGNLIQFLVLDTRQFRTDQPCPDQGTLIESSCKQRSQDPILNGTKPLRRHSILSAEGPLGDRSPWLKDVEESWLKERLKAPVYDWNVLAQQIPMFQYDHYDWTGNYYSESWDSYAAVRGRILNHIAQNKVRNPVVITGDMHSSWAANLEANFNDRTHSDLVAAEFAATSVSSGLSSGWNTTYSNAFGRPNNKHVKFYDGRTGGYGLCTIQGGMWRMDYYLAGSVRDPESSLQPIASYSVSAQYQGSSGVSRLQ